MSEIVLQKIAKSYKDEVDVAIKYYSIISDLNNLELTEREIQLLAFTAIRGTISSTSAKQEFCKRFGSSVATINNMISRLSSMGLMVKVNNKTRVKESIRIDFTKNIVIQLFMGVKENGRVQKS